jgi:hypothetical protein
MLHMCSAVQRGACCLCRRCCPACFAANGLSVLAVVFCHEPAASWDPLQGNIDESEWYEANDNIWGDWYTFNNNNNDNNNENENDNDSDDDNNNDNGVSCTAHQFGVESLFLVFSSSLTG